MFDPSSKILCGKLYRFLIWTWTIFGQLAALNLESGEQKDMNGQASENVVAAKLRLIYAFPEFMRVSISM